jgi:uncharacterized membrane protein
MSSLIAVGFKDEFTADQVVLELRKLQREHLVDLEDAAIVIRNKEGKVHIKQTQELTTAGALSGGFWGLLLGFIFFNPLLGWAVGALAGAVSGALTTSSGKWVVRSNREPRLFLSWSEEQLSIKYL